MPGPWFISCNKYSCSTHTARHCPKCFANINSLGPAYSPMMNHYHYAHFADKKAEAQRSEETLSESILLISKGSFTCLLKV